MKKSIYVFSQLELTSKKHGKRIKLIKQHSVVLMRKDKILKLKGKIK